MSNIYLIKKLWIALPKKRKKHLFFTLILMIISGIAEIISISSAVPFLSLLSKSQEELNSNLINNLSLIFNISNYDNLLFAITILFILIGILSGLLRIFNIWINQRMAALIGNELSYKAFKNVINQNYEIHIQRNSSEIISTLTSETQRTISALNLILKLLTNLILVISIISGLLIIEPVIIITVGFLFCFFYYLVFIITRNRLKINSKNASIAYKNHIQAIQEGLGDIRNVLIDDKQEFHLLRFNKWDLKLRNASAISKFISQFPKYVMETAGIVLIAIIAFLSSKYQNNLSINVIPIIGLTAISAQKLLPSFQSIYHSWSNIKDSSQSIINFLKLLEIKNKTIRTTSEKLKFKKVISLNNLSYKYPKAKYNSISNINIKIKKGEKIGITGETGSGKSTLIDILLGLLDPLTGTIEVDGVNINKSYKYKRQWQNNISHVPQNIFLADTSITQNIALGVDEKLIDLDKVCHVAKLANIDEFIKTLPQGYISTVGERGVKLSGGQVQRLGIARALYKDSNLLILDEATSALDYETEKNIMASIENLPKSITLIMIAHRLSTLKSCDRVFNIDRGEIK